MPDSQGGELLLPGGEKRIGANHKPAHLQLSQVCEDAVEVALGTGSEDMKF